MTTEPLASVKAHLSEVVDRIEQHHERVTITRNGRPAAVIMSPDDLESLEETLSIMSDPEVVADLTRPNREYFTGEQVRAELDERLRREATE